MPAMTMPYKVQDPALLTGRKAGDLITATLVVGEVDAYLTSSTWSAIAPLDTPAPVRDQPQRPRTRRSGGRRAARRSGRQAAAAVVARADTASR